MNLLDRLLLKDFQPISTLETPQTEVLRCGIPAIDVHTHIGLRASRPEDQGGWAVEDPAALVGMLDEVGVRAVVNLDGNWGAVLERNLDRYDRSFPGRIFTFCRLDYELCREPGYGEKLADLVEDSVRRGARGLKIAKTLGLAVEGPDGALLMPDDAGLDPVWARCGELSVPVLIHVADPVTFFRPPDRFNEGLVSLERHLDWQFHGGRFPSFHQLIDSLCALVERHSQTQFIGAHVGCYSENLRFVGEMCDRYPNFHPEISARIEQLGRQPYSAREFLVKYQDRVLYGTDGVPDAERHRLYFRFLETKDEYFPCRNEPGAWRIHGMHLGPEVLAKIYRDNAVRLLRLDG